MTACGKVVCTLYPVLVLEKRYNKPFSSYCQLKCFSAFEGMRTADIIRQEIEDLERLLQGNTASKNPQVKSPGYLTGTKHSNPILLVNVCAMIHNLLNVPLIDWSLKSQKKPISFVKYDQKQDSMFHHMS